MSKHWIRGIGLILLTSSPPVLAAEVYSVSTRFSHDGTVFATPRLTVAAGREARIESLGKDGYAVMLVVTDASDGSVSLKTNLHTAFGDLRPSLVMREGQVASISNADVEIEFLVTAMGS